MACRGPAVADDRFRDQVAPILQARCLNCHNDSDRKGELSLQTFASAFRDGHIEAGDADSSHLIELLAPTDGVAEMPLNADPLPEHEIAVLREWINDGAPWPAGLVLQPPRVADFDWWSYRPLREPPLPHCAADSWVRTPVDAFVLDRLQQQGLTPSGEADRRTLMRRLSFDLLGLPPDPADVESFVNDPDPRAYEHLVDRLLASPHYGERWARHWLDVVKYADTCGYDKDKLRPNAWPYRDYVIRSFNSDKPYGQFVQEQIAGDLLFPGQPEGIQALGFIAAGPWDFIGHVEVPESKIDGQVARNLDRDDMVANALNTFCSVTVQCARCHNHKFDPLTQEHYYGLQAVFADVDRADRPFEPDPRVASRRGQLNRQLNQLRGEQELLNAQMISAGGTALAELNRRIAELQGSGVVKQDPRFGYHSEIARSPDTEKWVQLDFPHPVTPKQIVLRPCHDEFAGIGAGFGFPRRFRVEISADAETWITVLDQSTRDYPNPGLTALVIDDAGARDARYLRITATRLAERSDDYILALAEIVVRDETGRNLASAAHISSLDSIEMRPRWSGSNLTDGHWPEWQNTTAEQPPGQAADARGDNDTNPLAAALDRRKRLLAGLETPEFKQRRESIERAIGETRRALSELPPPQSVYAAATDFEPQGNFLPTGGVPRPVFVLHRGEVEQPVSRARPGVIPLADQDDWAMDAGTPPTGRRAILAKWLTARDHPLVWRSIVNRVWQYHFGEGIVATPNDFGRIGALPSHPELLDWLAVQFRDHGQSLKHLHRIIVTSQVYRQSSRIDAARADIDGSNRFLWRMNRRRLTAEEIRDSILSVSGALNPAMGGPGYYLFALEKTEHSPHYEYHKFDPADPATHRRSIYRFIVRSQPDPWMTSLDCADSSQSTPRRNETLTALQALTLLNSRFNLEMAGRFADRLQSESDDPGRQVDRAISLLLQRPPDEAERRELVEFAHSHGLANLCRFLFNLSEFVFVD